MSIRFVSILFSLLFFPLLTNASTCVEWSSNTFAPQASADGMKAPDVGLYWVKYDKTTGKEQAVRAYTPNTVMPYFPDGAKNTAVDPKVDGGQARDAYNAKLAAGFYDPSKPTIIFFHGWQPNTTKAQNRFDLCYQYPVSATEKSKVFNTLKYWKGWNVAIFYWNQFADEGNVTDAESKIYSASAYKGMRWNYLDEKGQLQYCEDDRCVKPKSSISVLAYNAVRSALPSHLTKSLRITGQSLGAQIAIIVADKLLGAADGPQPSRLELLDPYFSNGNLGILNQNVAQYDNAMVKDIIAHNIPVAEYRTSTISSGLFGDWNPELMQMVAYMRLYPKYLLSAESGMSLVAEEHRSSIYLYFQSMRAPSFWDKSTQSEWDQSYVNAHSNDAAILNMMGDQRFQQASPTHLSEFDFPNTEDDVFNITDNS